MIYTSIDTLPLANYVQILKTGNLKPLKSNWFPVRITKLHKAWANIQNEVVELQLKDKDFVNMLHNRRRDALNAAKAATTNNPYLRHLAEIAKIEQQPQEVDFDFESLLTSINSTVPYYLDFRSITVKRFFLEYQKFKKTPVKNYNPS